MFSWGRSWFWAGARLAIGFVLAVGLVACNKRLKLILTDDDADAGAVAASTTARPPPTVPPPSGLLDDPGEGPDSPPTRGASGGLAGNPPGGPTPARTVNPPAKTVYAANCAGVCEKTLRCMNAYNAKEQADCVAGCKPNPTHAQLAQMDCPTLLQTLKNGNLPNSSSSGGGNTTTSSSGGAPSNCGPDKCATCVWDGTSCYSRVPPHLACDACCCRPGGPAPRWD